MKLSNKTLIALLAGLLVLSVVLGGVIWLNRPSGTQVVVTVNGKPYASFDLHTDQTIIISPEDGRWHNTLVIRDGTAYISESDCDNQICVHTPALTEDYFGIIVCLPHGIAVELSNSAAQ